MEKTLKKVFNKVKITNNILNPKMETFQNVWDIASDS